MTTESFITEALLWAKEAHSATGVLTSVILAQWAIETGWGGEDWYPNNNPGNVGSYDGQPVATFPTLAEGVDAYIQTMNASDRPEFGATIRKATTYQEQAYLLGVANPVWASSRYALPGGAPGSEIVSIIGSFDLTQYDTPIVAPPAPTPKPPAPEEATMNCLDPESGGTWVVDPRDGHVEASQFGGAPYLGGLNEPNADRDNWKEVGQIVGISPFKDASGWGYGIIVQHNEPIEPGGAWFSWYTFSRSGADKA